MTAAVIPFAPRLPARTAAAHRGPRGFALSYHHGEHNRCPGCGRSHWWVGRSSAECAFCATALPFVTPPPAAREEI